MDKMNILIACSDPIMVALLKHSLSETGVIISTTNDEQGLIDACKQRNYQLIISLFIHPFLNGSDTIMKIRKHGHPYPSVCMISWIQHEQTVVSLYENDVNQYFTLPVNMSRLTKKIKDQLLEMQQ